MKIEVFFSPAGVDELGMRGKNVVIIDVLRASTTICTALRNGAREVIPAPDIESATKISTNLSGDSHLLGGERQGKKIDGFDLGNSPFEYTPEKVGGKTIIFTTTNGAGAMYKCRYASMALVGGFVNASAVAQTVVDIGGTWTVLCSGRQGGFSIEDATCAGMIIAKVNAVVKVETDDAGLTSVILYNKFKKGILGMMKQSAHGKYLVSIGFEEDLKFCAEVDNVPVIPVIEGTGIKLKQNKLVVNG
ncbi:MAG TPA: 2-phosphosulfolactate phosphatase [Candidatus Acidoferrales bacterium]|nr:2-phosphosulfolactate phosphatase [Candidatus Acidoferrales bacterium]